MTQDEALTILKTGANVFLTGEPGSGKTHTVNQYVAYLRSCGIEPAVTASTGIAATHIGGQTLHSWCGIGVHRRLTEYDLDSIAGNRKVVSRVLRAKVLIIDEVSMLSGETLFMADAVCREVKRSKEPFGGLQVVFVGDFFQLPPVCRDEHGTGRPVTERDDDNQTKLFSREQSNFAGFAFASSAWQKASPLICYLSEQHRQEDPIFLEFLKAVRKGAVVERHKALLRARYSKSGGKGITQLYSRNANVDHLNTAELRKLPGQPKVFVMTGTGPDHLVTALKRGCLSPETLSLKIGARVIFTKNDVASRFVNGTIGTVTEFSKHTGMPVIKTDSGLSAVTSVAQAGRVIHVEPADWNMQDSGRVLATITQIPLRLAWALTVHKSQGMSLSSAHMDLSDAFEYGQGYVAISRVRTLQGLSLSGLNTRALEVHPLILAKDEYFRENSDAARGRFQAMEPSELALMHGNFMCAIGGSPGAGKPIRRKKETMNTLFVTKSLALQKLSIPDMAKKRGQTPGTILRHLEQLLVSGALSAERDLRYLSPDPDRFSKIEKAFKTLLSQKPKAELVDSSGLIKLSPARDLLDESFSFEELRLARLFLKS